MDMVFASFCLGEKVRGITRGGGGIMGETKKKVDCMHTGVRVRGIGWRADSHFNWNLVHFATM